MAVIASAEVERFLAKPDGRFAVVLVYGKDPGLVSERVRALIRAIVEGADDPLSMVRFDGDELAGEPARLAEEAHTVSLFGGHKAIWIRAGSKSFAAALDLVLKTPPRDALTVIEAGDLPKTAPLRALVERAKNAAALPCYLDDPRDIARLIDAEVRAAGLGIDSAARSELLQFLGGDRLSTRSEIAKLISYALKDGTITAAHVLAVCSDASDTAFDALVDAAFIGDRSEIKATFQRLIDDGNRADMLLAAVLRHGLAMARMASEVARGASPAEVASARVPYFKRRDAAARQLNIWSESSLQTLFPALVDAVLSCRRQPRLADSIAERRLLGLTALAAKGRRPTRDASALK